MANPFLVLGGIAISVATAAFGILQVPGWVASAQDAAAINDVTNVAQTQAVLQSQTGSYTEDYDALAKSGVKVSRSQGVRTALAFNSTGDHYVAVAKSQSGMLFARIDNSATIGSGRDLTEAVRGTGTTVTAGVTREGIAIADIIGLGDVVRTNLALNPTAAGGGDFTIGVRGGRHSIATDSALTAMGLPASYRRIDWTAAPEGSPVWIGQYVPVKVGQAYTYSAYARTSFVLGNGGARIDLTYYDKDGELLTRDNYASGPPKQVNGGWTRLSATATAPEGAAYADAYVAFSGPEANGAGGWVGATAFLIEEGSELRPFFYGSSGIMSGTKASWEGEPGNSQSVLVN